MVDGRYNSAFKRKNIRQLRRALKMTQKEFIDYFLSNSDNKPSMSIATLSNLESRGGERVNEVVSSVCTKLQIDTMLFSLSTEEFIKEIEKYLAEHKDNEELVRGIEKKGSISKLVNRLTMYFADEMLEGRLKRGDQIESDRELARKLGVGRSAV
ncbi:MAG: FadR family transcriptional regulator, partial [Mogibacterium diversum]|nr:FadR family transcriptional regulator [Mogibacterium diversum]